MKRASLVAILVLAGIALVRPAAPLIAKGGWETAGPAGGFVWVLAVSPAFETDRTVFAGTEGGGVITSPPTAVRRGAKVFRDSSAS